MSTGPTPVFDPYPELVQGTDVREKMLRLQLQADIDLLPTGSLKYSGISWTRVGVTKQPDVEKMLEKYCLLPPEYQQDEHLPRTFDEPYRPYNVAEFEKPPKRSPVRKAMRVVAVSCCKITLTDGTQEAVKVAVIDVATGRIILNHFVCLDPKSQVKDWNTKFTGFTCFKDIEIVRQAGYKVFKGWKAVRTALFKFIDNGTLLVGHNLRSDLDVLRITYGRGVDVAGAVEKEAEGRISNTQRSLTSLCRDLPKVTLNNVLPMFGEDCAQSAFAIRELALWFLKNEAPLKRWAKAKAIEYQRAGF
jgi:hypothetical protein